MGVIDTVFRGLGAVHRQGGGAGLGLGQPPGHEEPPLPPPELSGLQSVAEEARTIVSAAVDEARRVGLGTRTLDMSKKRDDEEQQQPLHGGGIGGAGAGGKARGRLLEAKDHHHHHHHQSFFQYVLSVSFFKSAAGLAVLFFIMLGMTSLPLRRLPSLERLANKAALRGAAEGDLENLKLKLPKDFEELRALKKTLDLYQQNYSTQVVLSIIAVYVFLQTFMIPGSIFLNILTGSMYPMPFAVVLINILGTMGSCICYIISSYFLRDLVFSLCSERLMTFAREVNKQRDHLTNYVLFLRVTPLLPNWFINAGSPLVDIPFKDFAVGTFIGLLPNVILTVKAGDMLSDINSWSDLYNAKTLVAFLFCGALAIAPVAYKHYKMRGGKSGLA